MYERQMNSTLIHTVWALDLYASSAINIATDILLCILPIPHLWALNLPVRQRIVLCILFAGGFG